MSQDPTRPTGATASAARLFRHRRGAHLQGPQPRQPDALGARLRRELHVYHRRHLPGAGGARRHLQGPAAPAALRLGEHRRSCRCPKGCRLVGVELLDEAVDLPSFRHPLRAAYVLGPEQGSLSPELLARCDHVVRIPIELLRQPGHGRRHRHVRPRARLGRFADRPMGEGGPGGAGRAAGANDQDDLSRRCLNGRTRSATLPGARVQEVEPQANLSTNDDS